MKETFEWVHSWCDHTNNADLPRVLLIGDSITNAYQEMVRERLAGVCYVDYMATSYSVENPIYGELVKSYFNNSRYDVIHFNHGLHGKWMSKVTYKEGLRAILKDRCEHIILASSTVVRDPESFDIDESWLEKLEERNAAMRELSFEYGYSQNDLFSLSLDISKEKRAGDPYHYTAEGSEILAAKVAEAIKEELKNI